MANSGPWWRDRRYQVLGLVGVVAGVALRIWILRSRISAFDSDEAVVALMARHIVTRHEFTVFFWGQAYGGSLESVLTAPLFAIFGATLTTLRTMLVAVSLVPPVLVYLIGRRTVGERPGLVAAVLVWIWPANFVWISTETRGFYWACLVLGLLFVLIVLRLTEGCDGPVEWMVLGLVGGMGFWTSPQFAYFAGPGALWLAWHLRRDMWRVVYALPFALLGAAPWIAYNVRHDLASFHAQSHTFDLGYRGNVRVLFRHGIPVALGLNVLERWLVPRAIYPLVVGGAAALLTRKRDGIGLPLLVAATYPIIWGVFPVSGVVGEGRYVMFLHPFLALLLARAALNVPARGVTTAGLVAGAIALSWAGAARIGPVSSALALDEPVPRNTGSLIRVLERAHVHHFYGNYWVAYRVAFETRERIIGSPTTDTRYARYDREVAADANPAHVFVTGTRVEAPFRAYLDTSGIPYRLIDARGFHVYLPARKVLASDVRSAP